MDFSIEALLDLKGNKLNTKLNNNTETTKKCFSWKILDTLRLYNTDEKEIDFVGSDHKGRHFLIVKIS